MNPNLPPSPFLGLRPKFNKANSYYRLDDLAKAMDLYGQVAAETKDMGLVAKAKYNTGNCYFQRGSKQRDSDLQKAMEELQSPKLSLQEQNQKPDLARPSPNLAPGPNKSEFDLKR